MKRKSCILLSVILTMLFNSSCRKEGQLIERTETHERQEEPAELSQDDSITSTPNVTQADNQPKINPTTTQEHPVPSLIAPMTGLDTNVWEVFPEAADLVHCQVTYITQSIDSTMWFGCVGGVSSYDGTEWKVYKRENEFSNSKITAVSYDPGGGVWVGTENDGLYKFDEGIWFHYTKEEGLIDNEVTAIGVSREGIVWIGTRSGITRLANNLWSTYSPLVYENEGYITSITATENGTVWAGFDNGGLVHFDGLSWHTKLIDLGKKRVAQLSSSSDGSVWMIRGESIVSISDNSVIEYPSNTFSYSPPLTITVTKDGSVWVGAWGGFKIATLIGSSWNAIGGEDIQQFTAMHNNALPFGGVFSIFEDSSGAFWFGTEWGAYRYSNQE